MFWHSQETLIHCRNPTLRECEDEIYTPEMGTYLRGVPRQKAIWMWVLCGSTNNTIWGKVVPSPESEL
jgi:hypothetical protein